MSEQGTKPFRVAISWLYYAHDHEKTNNSTARELMNMVEKSANNSWLQTFYVHHVREIVSAAELYTSTQGMTRGIDDDDIAQARRAQAVVRRGKAWLKEHDRS